MSGLYPEANFLLIPRNLDELVPVYVVLRTPTTDENTLKSYLGRLAINVEAYATSTAPLAHAGAPHAPPLKELLHSAPVQNPAEPVLFSSKGVEYENGNSQEYCYVAWKVDVFIGTTWTLRPAETVLIACRAPAIKTAKTDRLLFRWSISEACAAGQVRDS